MKLVKRISNIKTHITKEDIELVKSVTKELAKIMRVQDWNIEVGITGTKDMIERGFNVNTNGCYMATRKRNGVLILLNVEADELQKEGEWYKTLVHEMKHAQTIEFFLFTNCALEYIEDDRVQKKSLEDVEIMYESLVDKLAEEFVTIYPLSKILTSINPPA